jgi:hypothetical protein
MKTTLNKLSGAKETAEKLNALTLSLTAIEKQKTKTALLVKQFDGKFGGLPIDAAKARKCPYWDFKFNDHYYVIYFDYMFEGEVTGKWSNKPKARLCLADRDHFESVEVILDKKPTLSAFTHFLSDAVVGPERTAIEAVATKAIKFYDTWLKAGYAPKNEDGDSDSEHASVTKETAGSSGLEESLAITERLVKQFGGKFEPLPIKGAGTRKCPYWSFDVADHSYILYFDYLNGDGSRGSGMKPRLTLEEIRGFTSVEVLAHSNLTAVAFMREVDGDIIGPERAAIGNAAVKAIKFYDAWFEEIFSEDDE